MYQRRFMFAAVIVIFFIGVSCSCSDSKTQASIEGDGQSDIGKKKKTTKGPDPVNSRPKWVRHCALTDAEVEKSWDAALSKAKAAFETHKSKVAKKDLVVVINYDTLVFNASGKGDQKDRMRLYDVGQDWKVVQREWVSHAYKSGTDCATTFSNVSGSEISSKGAYVTLGSPYKSPRFGYPALKVKGLDKGVNDAAFSRYIIFHQSIDRDRKIDYSEGCFMTRPEVNKALMPKIAGGRFVYVHTSAPTK